MREIIDQGEQCLLNESFRRKMRLSIHRKRTNISMFFVLIHLFPVKVDV
jgi:hypothetical protein